MKKLLSQYKQVKQEHEMQAMVLKCFDSIAVISDVVRQNLQELLQSARHSA